MAHTRTAPLLISIVVSSGASLLLLPSMSGCAATRGEGIGPLPSSMPIFYFPPASYGETMEILIESDQLSPGQNLTTYLQIRDADTQAVVPVGAIMQNFDPVTGRMPPAHSPAGTRFCSYTHFTVKPQSQIPSMYQGRVYRAQYNFTSPTSSQAKYDDFFFIDLRP